jgi:hypothetical protein
VENLGLILLLLAAVYDFQISTVPGIVAFGKKIPEESRKRMKQSAIVGIDNSWNPRRNGPAHILNTVNIENGKLGEFEIAQKASHQAGRLFGKQEWNGSGSNEVSSEEMGRQPKVAVKATDQESKTANVVCKSSWKDKYGGNRAERALDTIAMNFQRRKDTCDTVTHKKW